MFSLPTSPSSSSPLSSPPSTPEDSLCDIDDSVLFQTTLTCIGSGNIHSLSPEELIEIFALLSPSSLVLALSAVESVSSLSPHVHRKLAWMFRGDKPYVSKFYTDQVRCLHIASSHVDRHAPRLPAIRHLAWTNHDKPSVDSIPNHLDTLSIHGGMVDARGLECLAQCASLRVLTLRGGIQYFAPIPRLDRLTRLESLELHGTLPLGLEIESVTLLGLSRLTQLSLAVPTSNDALASLASFCPLLESLSLDLERLNESVVSHWSDLPRLGSIDLKVHQGSLTLDPFSHLAALRQLRIILSHGSFPDTMPPLRNLSHVLLEGGNGCIETSSLQHVSSTCTSLHLGVEMSTHALTHLASLVPRLESLCIGPPSISYAPFFTDTLPAFQCISTLDVSAIWTELALARLDAMPRLERLVLRGRSSCAHLPPMPPRLVSLSTHFHDDSCVIAASSLANCARLVTLSAHAMTNDAVHQLPRSLVLLTVRRRGLSSVAATHLERVYTSHGLLSYIM